MKDKQPTYYSYHKRSGVRSPIEWVEYTHKRSFFDSIIQLINFLFFCTLMFGLCVVLYGLQAYLQ